MAKEQRTDGIAGELWKDTFLAVLTAAITEKPMWDFDYRTKEAKEQADKAVASYYETMTKETDK